ncbi:TolB family protein [Gottfriedia acidiceleris]|uniref:TolB family protein n=1 Tax=Gottfriedia acidiceleris TaxID=371036 RepID=UPI00101DD95F|nr:PD40 domain-containing protein [Gottfriedia acidiceleris]
MRKLSVSELLKIKEPADRVQMSVSPNGEWLAFCLNGKAHCHVTSGVSQVVDGNSQWVCNLITGETFQITNKAKSSWGGVWSPNGETLAFYADINNNAQVWLWAPSDKTLKLASEVIVRPFFGFEKPIWANDGKCIIVKSIPLKEVDNSYFYSSKFSKDIQTSKSDVQPKVFKTNQEKTAQQGNHNWINRYHSNISIIDIQTGQSNILFHDVFPVGMALSKSEKYLAFTNCLGTQKIHSQQLIYDLCITSIEQKNELVHLEKNIKMEYGLSFSWEQSRDSLIYTSIGEILGGEVLSIDIESSEKVKCFSAQPTILLGREYDGPTTLLNGDLLLIVKGCLWRFGKYKREIINEIKIDGRDILAVMPDSDQANQVVVQTIDKMYAIYGFYKVNYITGACMKLVEEPSAHLPWFEGGAVYKNTNKSEIVAFFSQSANEPPSIKILDVKTQQIRLSSKLSTIDTTKFGESELIFWKHGDRLLEVHYYFQRNERVRFQ